MTDLEHELAALIVESLALHDVNPADLDRDTPLFNEGLGLDSVDALELAMAVHKKYGVQIKADDPSVRDTFHSIGRLAAHIEGARRTQSR
ncbi:MAG TPA: phosphopantetheine-binding protein [Polyangiaceae bacterium]|nr:phosphopantetheine-binding protein [Polyangiaceae bacterium]